MVSFIHPGFLWFMSFAAVPVLLHLLNLRQLRVVVFPSVRFIRVSRQPQEGRRRLRHLLQLFLRIMLIVLGSLLLAGPQWHSKEVGSAVSRKTAMIVLDDTASMAWRGRMERALEHCRKLRENELDGWAVGLVRLSGGAGGQTAEQPETMAVECLAPTKETWRFDEALADTEATWLNSRPDDALRLALQSLSGEQKRLYVISDFQTVTWGHRMNQVPDDVELFLMDVHDAVVDGNCGIASVNCQRLGSRRLRVVTTVMNTSSREQVRELDVEIGPEHRRERLTVMPHGRNRVAMLFDDVELGQRGLAKLSEDNYPKDDSRLFWGDGVPPRKILLVIDGSHESVAPQEGDYVRLALESEVDGSGKRFVVEMQDVDLLTAQDVEQAQAVFLLGGAGRLQDDAVEAVKKLMEHGGCLFMTPGKNATGDFRRLLDCGVNVGRMSGMNGLSADARFDGVASVASGSFLSLLYEDVSESDMYTFAIRRCCRIRPSSGATVHIESLSGLPLLLETASGTGHCFVMAFGFADWWGDFQLTNSFLPLLHEVLEQTLAGDSGRKSVLCGAPLVSASDGMAMDTSIPSLLLDGLTYVEVNVDIRESQEAYVGELDLRDLLRRDGYSDKQESSHENDADLSRGIGILMAMTLLLEFLASIRWNLFRRHKSENE
ncbi:MAG: BatA domain-containing protein [Victivallales bacterium]|nr:BatA domain-containing protein [Victivallales bacterium]